MSERREVWAANWLKKSEQSQPESKKYIVHCLARTFIRRLRREGKACLDVVSLVLLSNAPSASVNNSIGLSPRGQPEVRKAWRLSSTSSKTIRHISDRS